MAALIIIDLQKAIDDPRFGPRNNPEAEKNVAALLARWRKSGELIIHVRHDSLEPDSPYRSGQPGNEFKAESMPLPGELVIPKQTNNAFIGTRLQELLAQTLAVYICGVITNNSVEATVRMSGNLGFETYLIEDACFAFAKKDFNGVMRTAEEVHAMSLANMDGEYCRVIRTKNATEVAST